MAQSNKEHTMLFIFLKMVSNIELRYLQTKNDLLLNILCSYDM